MLHFRMDMPLYLMSLYGSIMILVVCLLRRFLKNRLSKFVFPMLWALVLLRLLVPFSLSSPISGPVPDLYLQFIGDPTVYLVEDTDVVSEVASEATVYRFTESSRTLSLDWQLALLALLCLGGMITVGILLYQKRCYLKKAKK